MRVNKLGEKSEKICRLSRWNWFSTSDHIDSGSKKLAYLSVLTHLVLISGEQTSNPKNLGSSSVLSCSIRFGFIRVWILGHFCANFKASSKFLDSTCFRNSCLWSRNSNLLLQKIFKFNISLWKVMRIGMILRMPVI